MNKMCFEIIYVSFGVYNNELFTKLFETRFSNNVSFSFIGIAFCKIHNNFGKTWNF